MSRECCERARCATAKDPFVEAGVASSVRGAVDRPLVEVGDEGSSADPADTLGSCVDCCCCACCSSPCARKTSFICVSPRLPKYSMASIR